jgi:hypothetical protein
MTAVVLELQQIKVRKDLLFFRNVNSLSNRLLYRRCGNACFHGQQPPGNECTNQTGWTGEWDIGENLDSSVWFVKITMNTCSSPWLSNLHRFRPRTIVLVGFDVFPNQRSIDLPDLLALQFEQGTARSQRIFLVRHESH